MTGSRNAVLVLSALMAGCIGGCSAQGSGTGTTASPSSTLQTVAVSGPATVHLGSSQSFQATLANASGQSLQWLVDGVVGGTTATGSIDSNGVYTPPAMMPSSNILSISAQLTPAMVTGSLAVTLLQPIPTISAATFISTDGGVTGMLQVSGSQMNSTPVLLVDGVPVQSTQSANTLSAELSVAGLGTPSLNVTIENGGLGSQTSAPLAVSLQVLHATPRAAVRLLEQSTFGPTMTLIQQVEAEGLTGFIEEQLTEPPSQFSYVNYSEALPAYCLNVNVNCLDNPWFQHAIAGTDQLRQRVAFALSEMFVVSGLGAQLSGFPCYLNILSKDAFGNWRTLMEDVTLSVAMGQYLDMLDSGKPAAGQIANENYAREFLQLFSIGTNGLNEDGTPILDAQGNPLPNYTPDEIQNLARALTGWTYPSSSGGAVSSWPAQPYYMGPMRPFEAEHDTSAKKLLGGVVLPSGQTAEEDMEDALDNIFQQTSLPPFVCKQLIQHLVTSNPSSAYVSRVSQVFVNNGAGVRGDLQAVIRAILLDPEARALDDPSQVSPDFGHLKEPVLWITEVARGLQAQPLTSDAGAYSGMAYFAELLDEPLFSAPSVFNYFSPLTPLSGSGLLGPEFGIENTAMDVERMAIADWFITPGRTGNLLIDYSTAGTLGQLAKSSPDQLVQYLNLLFLHGDMPAEMEAAILEAMNSTNDPAAQAEIAVYLVISSSEFKVER